jgi:hypothetical protein
MGRVGWILGTEKSYARHSIFTVGKQPGELKSKEKITFLVMCPDPKTDILH